MIKIDNVNKYYNKGKSNQIHVIDNASITLPDKGIFCVLGPSGCGKTTLLNVIGGLDRVDSGSITIDGRSITGASSGMIDSMRNASVGYIFQNFNLIDDRTVFENVALALRMIGIKDPASVSARVRYCLEKVGIDQYRNKRAGLLSGGQRQRVAIARALVKDPAIIIADEPTGNLDSANTLEIMNIIKTISRDKLVVLVTHERNIAEFYSDHIAEMRDGKIINIYDNNTGGVLDYQLDNRIYLKDMKVHKGLRQDNFSIDVYSDNDSQTDIKLVVRDGNIYIDTNGKYKVADQNSNVQLIDEHYEALDETFFEDNDFDYTACLPPGYKAKYTPVYSFANMLGNGWKTVSNFSLVRKILLLGFTFAAMFAFLAISNVYGLLEVKPVDYRTTNGNYITIPAEGRAEQMLDIIGALETVDYVLPGETRKSVTLPLDDYIQTSYAEETVMVSIVLTSALDPDVLVAGSMPEDPHDVVIDKSVVEGFLRDDLGRVVCLESIEDFIGRKITIPNLEEYRIAGISDTESPSLFVDPDQATYIITNADDADGELSLGFLQGGEEEIDYVKTGKIMDLDLSDNRIKITKGKKPKKAMEVILNDIHQDEVKIGDAINVEAAGEKLKVVGFYTSDLADDDTYYVHTDTIEKDYAGKQKYISAYASDISLLKYILDESGVPSSLNDARDRAAYINVHKGQLMSAILVAAVIVLISLIEMFLMLRSSFLSRIKEVGTLRAIGLKKGDIYKMFTGEILVMTFITAVPGIALMYLALSRIVKATYYLQGQYMITPFVAAVTLALLLVFNLITGLIPVFATMRKTPAQILARSDI